MDRRRNYNGLSYFTDVWVLASSSEFDLFMKKILLLVFCNVFALLAFSQTGMRQKIADSILAEAKRIYRSEKASRYGAELFLEKFAAKEKIGGYFSYEMDTIVKCIFFSKGSQPEVLGTLLFDTAFNLQVTRADLTKRKMVQIERELFQMCRSTYAMMKEDSMFRYYQNTSFHLFPFISKNERRMYIVTGASQPGLVIFGNDYLIEFDPDFKPVRKISLHKKISANPYGNKSDSPAIAIRSAIHVHTITDISEYMTATDLYILMLYRERTGWDRYMVKGAAFASVWYRDGNRLLILPRSEMNLSEQ